MWSCETVEFIEYITSDNREQLVATTAKGNIMKMNIEKWEFRYITIHDSQFNDFCLVYPTGKYIVTLALNNLLSSWEVASGVMV